MAGNFIGPVEDVVEVLRAVLVAANIRFMPNSQVPASLGRAFVVAEEENLHVFVQQCPAFERIPLDNIAVAMKRLGSRKDGQHSCAQFVHWFMELSRAGAGPRAAEQSTQSRTYTHTR